MSENDKIFQVKVQWQISWQQQKSGCQLHIQRPQLVAETSSSDDSMEGNYSSGSVSKHSYALSEEREPNMWVNLPHHVLNALALVKAADEFCTHEAYTNLTVRAGRNQSAAQVTAGACRTQCGRLT